jgi:hypothetical protein
MESILDLSWHRQERPKSVNGMRANKTKRGGFRRPAEN